MKLEKYVMVETACFVIAKVVEGTRWVVADVKR